MDSGESAGVVGTVDTELHGLTRIKQKRYPQRSLRADAENAEKFRPELRPSRSMRLDADLEGPLFHGDAVAKLLLQNSLAF